MLMFVVTEEDLEKPVFEKKELNWEEDMEMHSKFLERKVRDSLIILCKQRPPVLEK